MTRTYRPGTWVVLRSDGRVVAWGAQDLPAALAMLAIAKVARPCADFVIAQVAAPPAPVGGAS